MKASWLSITLGILPCDIRHLAWYRLQVILHRRQTGGPRHLKIMEDRTRRRLDHGEMTRADLAERIGLTRHTLATVEQDKHSPSLQAAFRIAHVVGVKLAGVFQWDEQPWRLSPM